MTTSNPMQVVLPAQLNFHQVLNALDEFVDKYPAERADKETASRIADAARRLYARVSPNITLLECEITTVCDASVNGCCVASQATRYSVPS